MAEPERTESVSEIALMGGAAYYDEFVSVLKAEAAKVVDAPTNEAAVVALEGMFKTFEAWRLSVIYSQGQEPRPPIEY